MMDPEPELFIEQMAMRITPATQAMSMFEQERAALLRAVAVDAAGGVSLRVQCRNLVDNFHRALQGILLNTIHDREKAVQAVHPHQPVYRACVRVP